MPDPADSVRQLVASRLEERGLNMSEVSKRLGKNQTYIQQYVKKGSPRWLPEDIRPALAAILDMSENDLRRSPGVNPVTKREGTIPPAPVRVVPEGLIRVLGMAECGPDGFSLWNGDVVDYVPRPPNLAGAARAYAVFAQGTSMEPRYHAGEIVYIHPDKPVTPGCYVLVQLVPKEDGSPPRAVLKRLVRRTGNKVVLQQFEPAKTFDIKVDEIVSMHRAVGSGET